MVRIKIEPGEIEIKVKRSTLSAASSVLEGVSMVAKGESLELSGRTQRAAWDLRIILLALNECTDAVDLPYRFRAVACFIASVGLDRQDLYRCLDQYALVGAMRAIRSHVRWQARNDADPRAAELAAFGLVSHGPTGGTRGTLGQQLDPRDPRDPIIEAMERDPPMGADQPPSDVDLLLMLQRAGSAALVLGDKKDRNELFGFGCILGRLGSHTVARMTGNTGMWLRFYQKHRKVLFSKPLLQGWIAIELPGRCYGEEVSVKPLHPSRWIGDEFNEQVDLQSFKDGTFDKEDDALPEEISEYAGLVDACVAISRMGAVSVVVGRSGGVLYRSPDVDLDGGGCIVVSPS